jgi:hypothetical protein
VRDAIANGRRDPCTFWRLPHPSLSSLVSAGKSIATVSHCHERMGSVTTRCGFGLVLDLFATGKITTAQQITITKTTLALDLASSDFILI